MEKIKAAIIGLGRIGSLLEEDSKREKPCTHTGAISSNADCVLIGGCDINEERRKLFARCWGVPVYADAAEMLRSLKPQILVVATHPDSHYAYCRLAADNGIPVVICEKPLADTLGAARKIAALKGPAIICNHERRYSADYLKAREILAGGTLGNLLAVKAVLYMGETRRLLDVLWHDGTHLADAVMFLSGLILKHKKHWGAKLIDTGGTAWLEGELLPTPHSPIPVVIELGAGRDYCNPAPIPVVIEIGSGRDYLVFEIEFSCARGKLHIGNGVFEVWESDNCPYAEKFRSLKCTCSGFEGPTAYFSNMIADAVSLVRKPEAKPISSAEDGLSVIKYLNSVKKWKWRN